MAHKQEVEQALSRIDRVGDYLRDNLPGLYTTFVSLDKMPLDGYETAGVTKEGNYLVFSTEFINSLAGSELLSVIVHEVLHVQLGHLYRDNDYPVERHRLINIAMDFAVHSYMVHILGIAPATGGLYNKEYDDMTWEEIFKVLQSMDEEALVEECKKRWP